jgi:YrbI family 3-deoxy-D-manno-octulosonate 8-phosphate phosphatase
MRVLTIIPARGGSKGIPRKNIVPVAGKPLVAWSIEAALAASLVDEVAVSTDSEEIAAVSRKFGARVVMRPAELATDQASSEVALLHAVDQVEREDGRPIDLVVFLQATSPARDPSDIDGAVQKLLDAGADSCFSACAEHFTGRWRLSPEGSAYPVNFAPEKRPRRQEYPMEFLENGNIYVFKPALLRETGSRLGGKIVVYPMNAIDSIQIDCPEDLAMAADVLEIRRRRRQAAPDLSPLKAVRLLVLDFDGVMTDNRVIVDQDGRESVACHRGDSWGLGRLKKHGVEAMVLSTEPNPVVAARCKKLGIDCIHGSANKLAAIEQIARDRSLTASQIAYMGNDLNDRECMEWAGVSIAPVDALPEIIALADLVTPQQGGNGAVRQAAEWIIAGRQ